MAGVDRQNIQRNNTIPRWKITTKPRLYSARMNGPAMFDRSIIFVLYFSSLIAQRQQTTVYSYAPAINRPCHGLEPAQILFQENNPPGSKTAAILLIVEPFPSGCQYFMPGRGRALLSRRILHEEIKIFSTINHLWENCKILIRKQIVRC